MRSRVSELRSAASRFCSGWRTARTSVRDETQLALLKKGHVAFLRYEENGKEFTADSKRLPDVAKVADLCSSAFECLVWFRDFALPAL